jgi:serine/threonine protein kinase
LKPDNILLSGLENRTRVVIADFGLSVYKSKKLEIWPDNYGTIA